jgi:ABC-2 type transport system permease protein
VAVRVLFASLLTGALSALAVWGTGGIAAGTSDPEGITTAYTVAVFYGGVTYAALFTALALLTRRSLVSGLVYVLFWEGGLSTTFPALHFLSVRAWMQAVAQALTEAGGEPAGPSALYALIAGALLVAGTIFIGGRRLHQPRISRVGT